MPKRQIFTVTQVVATKDQPYAVYEARIWASGAPEAIRRARLGLGPRWVLVNRWGTAFSSFLHYTCDGAYELYNERGDKDEVGSEWQVGVPHRIALISQCSAYMDLFGKLPPRIQREMLELEQ